MAVEEWFEHVVLLDGKVLPFFSPDPDGRLCGT